MFELTVNGRTMTFNSSAEMEEWRQRMTTPVKIKKRKVVKTKKPKLSQGLAKFIKGGIE